MARISYGVTVYILLFEFTTCSILLPSSGCVKYKNETECTYSVTCSIYIDQSINNFHSNSMNGYRSYDYSKLVCTNYVRYQGNLYFSVDLKYKDDNVANIDISIPRSEHNYQYGNDRDYFYPLIVRMDVSMNEYKEFPVLHEMINLVFLNISNNALTVARLSNPHHLPLLEEIDLSFNMIASIEVVETQNIYVGLKNLNISHNYFVELSDSIFDHFAALEILDLSYNYIDTLSISAFEGVKKITHLYFSHNRLTELNRSLFRFTELKTLDISHNRMEYVKFEDFEKLSSLEKIDLSFNSINIIGQCAFCSMNFLQYVNLHKNKLTTISKETFSNVSSLNTVDLSNNLFSVLPKGMFKGQSVSEFGINGNDLKGSLSKGTFEGLRLVTRLDLSHQHLTSLEDYAFQGLNNVKTILLNNNNIFFLLRHCLKLLNNLNTLDLSNNNITAFNVDLEDLINLNTLVLKNNFLTQIHHGQFHGLNSLQFLDLANNKISKLEAQSLNVLQELVNFQISNNPLNGTLENNTFVGLNSLPSLIVTFTQLIAIENNTFIGMSQLRELNMSHGKIEKISFNAFSDMGTIEVIDLSFNQLRSFNVNTTDLGNVDIIFISNNLLKSITETMFIGLSRLTKLFLAHNDIESVHSSAFDVQKGIEHLDLSFNSKLNFNASVLAKNKNLRNLYLSGTRNYIKFIPVEGTQLTSLKMSYSSLKNITENNLKELTQLENLEISNNEIAKLEVGYFTHLSQLRMLDISYNKIYFIQPGVFKDNVHLQLLNISHNSLTSISYGIFRGLIYLNTLDLSYNSINSIEGERFYDVKGLTSLIVDNNKISSINAEDFVGTSLNTLSVGGNPLPCELLVNIHQNPLTFSITAIKLSEHAFENVAGVTCNMNGYIYKKTEQNASYSDDNTRLLFDIRELLTKLANKNTESEHSVLKDSLLYFKNLTYHVDNITNEHETNWKILSNSTSLLTAQSNNTNVLLSKILSALNKKTVSASLPSPSNNNGTETLINYIDKIKEELENTIAAEKENILLEVEKKVSSIDSKRPISKSTKRADVLPSIVSQDKLQAQEKVVETRKSSLFTETCVGLILVILVCFVLYQFYKSRMFVRASRSYSTRELPGAMESPNL